MSNDAKLLYTRNRPSFASQLKDGFHHLPYHTKEYIKMIFPIRTWIGRYNLTWFTGDLIAGLTVGAVVIPQSMGFANIVGIPVQYGLYSSFVGVIVYCLFATSKDMTIGPTAVMAITLAQAIPRVKSDYGPNFPYSGPDITTTLCFFSGIFSMLVGFLRLGWFFNFIPGPVITGYITASVITISIGQLPNLFGITGVETRTNPPYRVLIDFFAALPRTKIDASVGLVSLAFLYAVKYGSTYGEKRYPKYKKTFFFASILRYIICIIVTTFIAWLVLKDKAEKDFNLRVVKTVPRGFNHVRVPPLSPDFLPAIFKSLPIVILISLLEHIAIGKSFGRVNDYKINPSQEIIAIGVTNIIGCFLGAYTATGSFSRSALKSRTGVRTPLAGIFSGILVLLALYVLTPAFYFIPQASLAAVIIQAVMVLVVPWSYVKLLYTVQIWDLAVFVVAIIISLFTTLDWGIIASWGLAFIVLLIRIARPRVDALGRLILSNFSGKSGETSPKYAYVSLDHPSFATIEGPPDGIVVFRFEESLTFPNASLIDDRIVDYIKMHTRRMHKRAENKGDQPWNEDVDYNFAENEKLPEVRAIIFDCSAVTIIDTSGLQSLLDIKKALNKHAARNVEYHFTNILNEDVQNTLIKGGFGANESPDDQENDEKKVNDEEINRETTLSTQKRYFHFTIDEAIAAAQS